jgi:hypothetical protein
MDEVGERAQCLVDVGAGLGPVHLVDVDPLGVQAPEARLHLLHDPAPRVPLPVQTLAHLAVELRREDDLVATAGERLPDDLLVLPLRVDVGGVDDVDPRVERGVDDPDPILVIGVPPGAEHHRAQAELAHLDAGCPQLPVLHGENLAAGAGHAPHGSRAGVSEEVVARSPTRAAAPRSHERRSVR